jgi:predicted P-loop ATPase
LRDETGGRRFWPVACTHILNDELARDRDQLWAEAVTRYRAGAVWWLESVELNKKAEEEQAERYEGDVWDPMILEWANSRVTSGSDSVSVGEVLDLCLGKKRDQWTRGDQMRVGRCLTAAKWERYRDRKREFEWRYKRTVPTSG